MTQPLQLAPHAKAAIVQALGGQLLRSAAANSAMQSQLDALRASKCMAAQPSAALQAGHSQQQRSSGESHQ